jgi:hypothetical protein
MDVLFAAVGLLVGAALVSWWSEQRRIAGEREALQRDSARRMAIEAGVPEDEIPAFVERHYHSIGIGGY